MPTRAAHKKVLPTFIVLSSCLADKVDCVNFYKQLKNYKNTFLIVINNNKIIYLSLILASIAFAR